MFKNTLCILGLLLSFSSYSAEKYIMVVFHGLGGFEADSMKEEANIPANLSGVGITKFYNAGHGVSDQKFTELLKNFNCRSGAAMNKDLGLIIVGYSWGARKSYEFSKTYEKKCGIKADRAYMIDGIQKLVSQFKNAPIAKICKNYYKTISPIRGRALDNCENTNLTEVCKIEGGQYLEGMPCHQAVLKEGFKMVMQDIQSI
jgi:hypothetical protein